MKSKKLARRIIQYVIGIICMAIGLVLLKKTVLGVSPITAVPDAVTNLLTAIDPDKAGLFSLGNTTIALHLLCVIGQIIIQKRVTLKSILCMCVGVPFGKLVDLFMLIWGKCIPALPAWSTVFTMSAGSMIGVILIAAVMLVVGIAIQGFGVALISGCDLMLPAPDEMNNVISRVYDKKLGNIKMVADACYVAVALIINFFMYAFVTGFASFSLSTLSIGISSIASVLLTGRFVGLTFKLFPKVRMEPFFNAKKK